MSAFQQKLCNLGCFFLGDFFITKYVIKTLSASFLKFRFGGNVVTSGWSSIKSTCVAGEEE